MSKKKLMVVAVVTALSTGLVASGMSPVLAADLAGQDTAKKVTAAPSEQTAEKDLIRVSEDASLTMRNVRGARFAIFNGSPDKAQTYADAALARVALAVKDAEKYAVDTKDSAKVDDNYVPFDASLTVAEDFIPSEEKIKHIGKANEHLHKGEKEQAIEILKLAGIDVAVATKMVPVKYAQTRIAEADKLVSEGKYYQANLMLKAVEDAVVVETFAIDATPKVANAKH